MKMNDDACYRALAARDARFDGVFFVGVTSTGIYCRPVCPARSPRRENCRFFPHAAAAECAGFRPCLRCRPELAPGLAPVDAVGRTARLAAARIEAGALNGAGGLETLAKEFGLSSRQLRRVVRKELGASPVELAQTARLLLAKRLLAESRLPVIRVAFASGFESVRRFNALFRSHYGLTPTRVRRAGRDAVPRLEPADPVGRTPRGGGQIGPMRSGNHGRAGGVPGLAGAGGGRQADRPRTRPRPGGGDRPAPGVPRNRRVDRPVHRPSRLALAGRLPRRRPRFTESGRRGVAARPPHGVRGVASVAGLCGHAPLGEPSR
jgi:methylphosphotriester-DNA--protein-cysteine methyltransferase